jgi:hypothetical protein
VPATREASRYFRSTIRQQGITPAAKSPPSISSRASSCHPEVPLLSRGLFPERPAPRSGTPRVYSVRRRFSAPAHTAHGKPGLCVVCLPAISAFQRYSSHHLLSITAPLSVFTFVSAVSRPGLFNVLGVALLRLGLPTPGLVGSPHVHSSCLAPGR